MIDILFFDASYAFVNPTELQSSISPSFPTLESHMSVGDNGGNSLQAIKECMEYVA